jgi:phosphate-selective porin OprO and OprP
MMSTRIALSVLMVLVISIVFTQSVIAQDGLDASWSKGIRLNSEDGSFKLKIGGRIMNDWAFFDEDADSGTPLDGLQDGNEFRRARLYFAGLIYDSVDFKAEYDFAGGDADFKDVYLRYKVLPIDITVGHFKEPFGLEEITSSNNITFMERSTATEAFSPSRNTGVGVGSALLDNMVTWSVGAFRDSDGFGDGEGSNYHYTGRVTAIPWSNEEQSQLLHVGGSVSYRNVEEQRYSSRPESHLAPQVVDTGDFNVDSAVMCGLESAVVLGPLSFQGEYMSAMTDSEDGSDPDLCGWYLAASWFATGESRAYKSSSGIFGRVSPNANAGSDGAGALELAARYSSLDLSDGTVDGGEVDDVTLAVNWYLNPNARVMFNYVNSDADENGEVDVYQTRFQVDF